METAKQREGSSSANSVLNAVATTTEACSSSNSSGGPSSRDKDNNGSCDEVKKCESNITANNGDSDMAATTDSGISSGEGSCSGSSNNSVPAAAASIIFATTDCCSSSSSGTTFQGILNNPESDDPSNNGGDATRPEASNKMQKQMEAEERKAERKNRQEEKKIRKEIEAKEQDAEVKDQRYKRLMHLLTKSQFYSQFLLEKISSQTKAAAAPRKRRRLAAPAEDDAQTGPSSSQGSSSGGQRPSLGVNHKESPEAAQEQESQSNNTGTVESSRKRLKRNAEHSSDYQIVEIIDKEVVAEAAGGGQEEVDAEMADACQQPELLTGATLRPYQLDGFNWLKVMYENGVNGLLADEMGLGKTVQSIALFCHLVAMGVPGPFLVVAPLSTLHNWCNEIRAFAPQLPVLLYHGSEQTRQQKLPLIEVATKVTTKGEDGVETVFNVRPIVVTSYEMATISQKQLGRHRWRYLIVDEGHRIKNFKCQLVKALKQYHSNNRLLLTGTPLQNNLAELWSLLNFLLPEVFDSLDVFESWFDTSDMTTEVAEQRIMKQERESRIISTMHKILSPFLLRRVKADVELNLPAKRELLVYAHMTAVQMPLYKATLTRDCSALKGIMQVQEEEMLYDNNGRPIRRCKQSAESRSKHLQAIMSDDDSEQGLENFLAAAVSRAIDDGAGGATNKKLNKTAINVKLQNVMMQCRRIVNHPYLVAYPLTPAGEYKVDEQLVTSCGKLQVLDQLLSELYKRGHKVLLFSQMTKLLDILHDYLTLRPQYNYRRLDGRVSLEQRQHDIDEFNNDPSVFLFLLSTRAGSLGINLTAADTCIIYDSDWNPQQDLQAQDRCHRIGQTRPVLVLRLVTQATVDERIVERANSKRCLEKLIMKAGQFTSSRLDEREVGKIMDTEELLKLFEERDHHGVYRTRNDGAVFSKEELERILDRSELTVVGGKNNNKENSRDEAGNERSGKNNRRKRKAEDGDEGPGFAGKNDKSKKGSGSVFKVLEEN